MEKMCVRCPLLGFREGMAPNAAMTGRNVCQFCKNKKARSTPADAAMPSPAVAAHQSSPQVAMPVPFAFQPFVLCQQLEQMESRAMKAEENNYKLQEEVEVLQRGLQSINHRLLGTTTEREAEDGAKAAEARAKAAEARASAADAKAAEERAAFSAALAKVNQDAKAAVERAQARASAAENATVAAEARASAAENAAVDAKAAKEIAQARASAADNAKVDACREAFRLQALLASLNAREQQASRSPAPAATSAATARPRRAGLSGLSRSRVVDVDK